ncbi:MAG: bifunctional oligoribonuclease/PAP phosphatase NrnA [Atopobiaceae bacterium]
MLTTRTGVLCPAADGAAAKQNERFDDIASLIQATDTIAICAHTSPDGDALGSGLALAAIIRQLWPHKQVTNLLADDAPIPRIYRFLPGVDDFVPAAKYTQDPDLFIAVDLSVASRLNDAQAVLARSRMSAVMDHHPCQQPFGDSNIVRPGAAATGVIVTEFAQHLGAHITPDIAECLYCAITTDTGRFQYQNADGEAFEVASLLVDAGASPSNVSLHVYQSFRIQYLHLEALVMGRIVTFSKGRIAYSYATQNDFERTGAHLDESEGLIDDVRSVEGSEVALFLKEVPGGKVRGNLRSKGEKDVSAVAEALGGGGHRAAAGFTVVGDIDQALSASLPLLKALFGDEEGGVR